MIKRMTKDEVEYGYHAYSNAIKNGTLSDESSKNLMPIDWDFTGCNFDFDFFEHRATGKCLASRRG